MATPRGKEARFIDALVALVEAFEDNPDAFPAVQRALHPLTPVHMRNWTGRMRAAFGNRRFASLPRD
jgi:hypothetical protein